MGKFTETLFRIVPSTDDLSRHWTGSTSLSPAPSTFATNLLLYADEAPLTQPDAEALKQAFFTNVTKALNLTTSSINITSSFLSYNVSQTSPPTDVADFMQYVYSDQNSVEGWDEIGKPLTQLYQELYAGASPPAGDPPVNISWLDGQNPSTRARFPESQRRRAVFADWWNSEVQKNSSETCTESIFAHSYHTAPTLVKVTATTPVLTYGWYNGVAISKSLSHVISAVACGSVEKGRLTCTVGFRLCGHAGDRSAHWTGGVLQPIHE